MTEKEIKALLSMATRVSLCVKVARAAAHDSFDPIWQSGQMSRTAAYRWMAKQMLIPEEECHIKKFSVEQCHRVVDICHDRERDRSLLREAREGAGRVQLQVPQRDAAGRG